MNLAEQTKLLWFASAGDKKREDTIYKFLTKAYDASYAVVDGQKVFNENHLVQTTELSQPRIVGGIAPGSKLALYNGNGESRYLTHPKIAFASDEAWSLTCALNWNGSGNPYVSLCGSNPYHIKLRELTNKIGIFNTSSASVYFSTPISQIIGKNTVLQLIASGANELSLYINGLYKSTISCETGIQFSSLLYGYTNRFAEAGVYYYRIQSGSLTAAKVAAEAAMIRTWLPEIESVDIGTQTWATSNLDMMATPEGNVISEMQLASDTEKITNADDREFNSDTGFWGKTGTWVISGGVAERTAGTQNYIYKENVLTIGKWYKVNVDINLTSGSLSSYGNNFPTFITGGSKELYFKAIYAGIGFGSSTFIGSIDNVSYEEVGWSGLGDLYTWLTTEGGYTAYNALKEVAAWCYYNNDADNGAVYGKLYNWYAASLLDTDMASAGFGWHVPTSAEFDALATELGGLSAAGGPLKISGTDYWDTESLGADNSSGFTLLGGGRRTEDGSFVGLKALTAFWSSVMSTAAYVTASSDSMSIVTTFSAMRGFALRLIKD